MRKILISVLLATVAASPAFAAQDRDSDGRPTRDQIHADRLQEHSRPTPQAEAPQQVPTGNRQRADGVSRWTRDSVQQPGDTTRWTRDPAQRTGETERWTRDRTGNGARNGFSGQDVQQATQSQGGSRNPQRSTAQRHEHNRISWNRDWRNDARYDWRRYREHHRSIFHLGIYSDPFGFGYRPFAIGYHLGPAYYAQRYWIDPAMYGLPFPPPGTMWVRYWNDALLVDTWTGEVVDVIPGFFW